MRSYGEVLFGYLLNEFHQINSVQRKLSSIRNVSVSWPKNGPVSCCVFDQQIQVASEGFVGLPESLYRGTPPGTDEYLCGGCCAVAREIAHFLVIVVSQ